MEFTSRGLDVASEEYLSDIRGRVEAAAKPEELRVLKHEIEEALKELRPFDFGQLQIVLGPTSLPLIDRVKEVVERIEEDPPGANKRASEVLERLLATVSAKLEALGQTGDSIGDIQRAFRQHLHQWLDQNPPVPASAQIVLTDIIRRTHFDQGLFNKSEGSDDE